MREKNIILAARVISIVFTPFYLPLLGLIVLFLFSYLNQYPWEIKLKVVALVYCFTILLPTVFIRLYRRYQGWTPIELGIKERRMVPYIISIVCYFACYFVLNLLHIPHFMSSILVAALIIQIICAFINIWWKISTHSAAVGGIAGALLSFAMIFAFNPIWWLCVVLILSGMVGTSRMILRQHTLLQIVVGFFVGLIVAFFIII